MCLSEVFTASPPLFFIHLRISSFGEATKTSPTPEFLALYDDVDIPIDPVSKAEIDLQPKALQALRKHNVEVDHDSIVHQLEPSMESRLRQRKHYLANVTMIDDAVGKIRQCLQKNHDQRC